MARRRVEHLAGPAACALLAGLAVSACLGSGAPRDSFYRLEITRPETPRSQPALNGTLEIERLRSDALTRERGILHVQDAESVQVTPYGYHLWVDSPTMMLQWELADYLRRANVAERVVLPEMNVNETWELNGWIDRLVHVTGGGDDRVVVVLEFSVTTARGNDLVLRQRYRAEVPAPEGDIDAAVRGFSKAVSDIFARLESDLAAAGG